ncbi:glycolate oxidase subunit GlcE [uncultured Amphritea sp.]|uniref:glycolate oxidase subunit GlcE n=1 Tax=uncultured Amphritea sp. TaxID=981605 RepID=UPI002616DFF1|nr:glycolate oxidase subunit GlcE [uncultured Amphritea sp.]
MADISPQIQQQILDARRDKRQLNIVAGNSKPFMGRQTHADTLNVSQHRGIISYQPVELVLTARSGTPLTEIEALLDEHNQMLAFEPPRFSAHSTIGGTLACNLSGPGRPWSGSIRDHILGVRLINGLGEHLKFGGQVMKNVAGYDVSRLQAGAMGTLGVLTEVSLKVLPKPAAVSTLSWELEAKQAIRMMNELAGKPKPISAACWIEGRLYIRLSGAQSAVDATIKEWHGSEEPDADNLWLALRDQQLSAFQSTDPLWRLSINAAADVAPLDHLSIIDWGGAQRWYRGHQDKYEMETLAERAGGQVSLYTGGDRTADVFHQPVPALQEIQKRIKASFDPDGILNSGRLYSWM